MSCIIIGILVTTDLQRLYGYPSGDGYLEAGENKGMGIRGARGLAIRPLLDWSRILNDDNLTADDLIEKSSHLFFDTGFHVGEGELQ